jgi:hypothetical protein
MVFQKPSIPKKFPRKFFVKNPMEHRLTYKTPDGVLQETLFNNFNEFADNVEDIIGEYYRGFNPEFSVDTIYNNMVRKERVSNEQELVDNTGGMEQLSEHD